MQEKQTPDLKGQYLGVMSKFGLILLSFHERDSTKHAMVSWEAARNETCTRSSLKTRFTRNEQLAQQRRN